MQWKMYIKHVTALTFHMTITMTKIITINDVIEIFVKCAKNV